MPDAAADAPAAMNPPRRGLGGAVLVGGGIFLSRVAGLVRERVFAHYFGNSAAADVFRVALRIPNLLQNLFGEGVLSASFIPVYATLLAKKDDAEARRVAGAVFSLLALATSAVVLLGMALTPLLVDVFTPGFEGEKRDAAIRLVRILYPGTGLLVLSAWCLGILNSHRRFFLSYAAPVVWNAAIVAAMLWAGSRGIEGYRLAWWTAWGAFAGCALQFAVQLPAALVLARGLAVGLGRGSAQVVQVLRMFVPVVFSRGVVQISAYVDTFLASFLPSGSLAAIGYAQILYTLPVSLFGMAVSASELPEMSREAATGDAAAEALRARLAAGLRRITFLVVPSAVAFVAIGDVLVGLLFRTGEFGADDVRWVWAILAAAAVGLLAATLGRLYSSAFYALRDAKTPLRFAIARVLVGTAAGALLAFIAPELLGVEPRWGAAGIALGSSLGAWLEYALLRASLTRRIGATGVPGSVVLRFFVSAALAGALAFGAKLLADDRHPVLVAAAAVPVFGLVYFGAVTALGLPEAKDFAGPILRRLRRR